MVLTLLYFIKIKKYNIYIMRKTVEKILVIVLIVFILHNLYGWLVSREGLENKTDNCDKSKLLLFKLCYLKHLGKLNHFKIALKVLKTQVTNLTQIAKPSIVNCQNKNKEQIEKGKDKIA